MEKFSLEKYLENPSRKVVTRDGRPVRIICWDRQCKLEYNYPVIALVSVENTETPVISNKEGKTWNNNEINDLFFADEAEEMTEFEKAIYQHICTMVTACDGELDGDEILKPVVKGIAKELLDLARKELKEDWRTPLRLYKRAYEQGKKDALKDLPKWKKAERNLEFNKHVVINEEDRVSLTTEVYKGEYYIDLIELLKLPKEE